MKFLSNVKTVLRRWAPLTAVLYLSGMGILKAAGQVEAASMLEFMAGFLGVVISDPEAAASIPAFAGGGYKLVLRVIEAVKASKDEQE